MIPQQHQQPVKEELEDRWLPVKHRESPPGSRGPASTGPPQLPFPAPSAPSFEHRREWSVRPRVVAEPAVGPSGPPRDLVLPPLSRVFDANFDSSGRRPRAATGAERLPSFASQGFAALKSPPAPAPGDFSVLPSPGTSSGTPSGLPTPLSRQDSYFVDRPEATTTMAAPAKPYDRPSVMDGKRASPPWARPLPYDMLRTASSTSPPQQPWRDAPPSPSKRPIKAHVSSACLNCKKAHVACDVGRPCRRCINLGRTDTCIDVQHKKRGRPRLAKRTASSSAIPTSQVPMSLSSLDETKAAALHANEAIIRAMGQTYDMHGRRHSRSAPSSPTGERYRELAHSMHPPPRHHHLHGDPRSLHSGMMGASAAPPPVFSLSAFHRRQDSQPDEIMDRPHTSHHAPSGPSSSARHLHEAVGPHHLPSAVHRGGEPRQGMPGHVSPPSPQHPHGHELAERYDASPPDWRQRGAYQPRSHSPPPPPTMDRQYRGEPLPPRAPMPPPPPHPHQHHHTAAPPREWIAPRV